MKSVIFYAVLKPDPGLPPGMDYASVGVPTSGQWSGMFAYVRTEVIDADPAYALIHEAAKPRPGEVVLNIVGMTDTRTEDKRVIV